MPSLDGLALLLMVTAFQLRPGDLLVESTDNAIGHPSPTISCRCCQRTEVSKGLTSRIGVPWMASRLRT